MLSNPGMQQSRRCQQIPGWRGLTPSSCHDEVTVLPPALAGLGEVNEVMREEVRGVAVRDGGVT